MYLQMENEKVRSIPHYVIAPLAVSGKCFSSQITGVCEVSKRIIAFHAAILDWICFRWAVLTLSNGKIGKLRKNSW